MLKEIIIMLNYYLSGRERVLLYLQCTLYLVFGMQKEILSEYNRPKYPKANLVSYMYLQWDLNSQHLDFKSGNVICIIT